ncbi:hypothetical protein K435DRAFT_650968 [Dendrothele bispora CBS 962.96]|uniref:Prolyl 4-hydroxylase alpha subunit Fe(2+) 2OG dioxygenase domain-containing protein n=1 Tax=Dendrothele bispora (strain CBS 962.96) TaxID=1314807 RepID=A0A4S8ML95_DENBC|nr:hypothetical protein K435DRAFT_650968 [Dendrothele bispora CBS 962.96]
MGLEVCFLFLSCFFILILFLFCSSCCPILDSQERVVAVLAGQPQAPNWKGLVSKATEAIARAGKELHFTDKQLNSGRGEFPAIAIGVSFGGGRKVYFFLVAFFTLTNVASLQCFQSLTGFANVIFHAYAPQTFDYYWGCMRALRKWNPRLREHFNNNVFASCTINFGPFTVCRPHTDRANLSFGWCAITALGRFDPDKGGHLILWDLGLIIRFPPGSTILIPSALITHSNVPIQEGETRYSFVQYSAAGLFRWVYNGFKSDVDFEATATSAQSAKREEDRKSRWKKGVGMFAKWSDLLRE